MSDDTGGVRNKFFTAAGVAAVLAGWYGLPHDNIQRAVCSAPPPSWSLPTWLCDPAYVKLAPTEATQVVDTYLRKAGGASPGGAFAMLDGAADSARDRFVEEWDPILFADRQDALEATTGLNRYVVTYRTYDGGGDPVSPRQSKIATFTQELRVLGPIEEPRIRLVGERTRSDGLNDTLPLVQQSPAHTLQTRNSPSPGGGLAASKVMPDKKLSLLCQVQTSSGWWSRTGWGWTHHADLVEGDVQTPGELLCDDHNRGG